MNKEEKKVREEIEPLWIRISFYLVTVWLIIGVVNAKIMFFIYLAVVWLVIGVVSVKIINTILGKNKWRVFVKTWNFELFVLGGLFTSMIMFLMIIIHCLKKRNPLILVKNCYIGMKKDILEN